VQLAHRSQRVVEEQRGAERAAGLQLRPAVGGRQSLHRDRVVVEPALGPWALALVPGGHHEQLVFEGETRHRLARAGQRRHLEREFARGERLLDLRVTLLVRERLGRHPRRMLGGGHVDAVALSGVPEPRGEQVGEGAVEVDRDAHP
jgi:hypothetical protein